jgi:restriction system protein
MARSNSPTPSGAISTGVEKVMQQVVFTDTEVAQLSKALRNGMLPKTWATRRAHISYLHERHQSTTACPKCGSPLVRRTAKSGPNTGRAFLGCSGFPKCRHTAQVTDT